MGQERVIFESSQQRLSMRSAVAQLDQVDLVKEWLAIELSEAAKVGFSVMLEKESGVKRPELLYFARLERFVGCFTETNQNMISIFLGLN